MIQTLIRIKTVKKTEIHSKITLVKVPVLSFSPGNLLVYLPQAFILSIRI